MAPNAHVDGIDVAIDAAIHAEAASYSRSSQPSPTPEQLQILYSRADDLESLSKQYSGQQANPLAASELHKASVEIKAAQSAKASGDETGFKYHLNNIWHLFGDSWKNMLTPGPLLALGTGAVGYAATHGSVSSQAGSYYLNPAHRWTGLDYKVGDYIGQGFILVPWLAVSATFGDQHFAKTTDEILASTLNTAIITDGLKYAVNQPRPTGGNYGFPSGHSSFSFSMATVIAGEYGWKAGIPAYAIAAYVGASRIGGGEHYPSQVIAGAAIGVASGLATLESRNQDFSVGPGVVNGAPGIVFHKDIKN